MGIKMAFYLFGSYIREQRERLGVTQEELCEGICSTATLSKIENGHQSVRLNQYIALMQRLGLPMQPIGIHVTEDEMRWYNLKREIAYKIASHDWEIEELLEQLEKCSAVAANQTEQYIYFVKAGKKKWFQANNENNAEVMELLLHAIHCTYKNFDIDNTNSVKLLTSDEIMIIDNIASVFKMNGDVIKAIKWGYFLKDYLERSNFDYDEVVKVYPLILYNLCNWLVECKQYNEALELCDKGINYCNKHGKMNLFGELMYNKGRCYLELNNIEAAVKCISYAYIIFDARGYEDKKKMAMEKLKEQGVTEIIL